MSIKSKIDTLVCSFGFENFCVYISIHSMLKWYYSLVVVNHLEAASLFQSFPPPINYFCIDLASKARELHWANNCVKREIGRDRQLVKGKEVKKKKTEEEWKIETL